MREYLPVLMFLLVAIAFAAGTIGLSTIIVPRFTISRYDVMPGGGRFA